jgi:hypothetical protein
LFSKEDAIAVGKWLKGARHYSIQQFRNSQPMVGSRMQNVPPYSESELKEIAEAARPFFGKVEVKNL